jgi:hypothetical protein
VLRGGVEFKARRYDRVAAIMERIRQVAPEFDVSHRELFSMWTEPERG